MAEVAKKKKKLKQPEARIRRFPLKRESLLLLDCFLSFFIPIMLRRGGHIRSSCRAATRRIKQQLYNRWPASACGRTSWHSGLWKRLTSANDSLKHHLWQPTSHCQWNNLLFVFPWGVPLHLCRSQGSAPLLINNMNEPCSGSLLAFWSQKDAFPKGERF